MALIDRLTPPLADWADQLETLQWSAALVDPDWSLAWVTTELKGFLGVSDDTNLGYGKHIAEALLTEPWLRTVSPDSFMQLFTSMAPYLLYDFEKRGRDPNEILGDFTSLIDGLEAQKPPYLWSDSFEYIKPDRDEELKPYRVNYTCIQIHDDQGAMLGWVVIFFMGVRPNLLELLARGDEEMYERMAALVDPGPRQAAILFCDLDGSGPISRHMSSANYFRLVRRLWTGIDRVVANQSGIIGKHAGDGASAYFLVEDLGSESAACAAAVAAAREIHEHSEEIFRETLDSECLMRVGIHWGAGLYMGQLVPGGRLDVGALGDEVKETLRIEETAEPGTTLVSKQLIEQLNEDDAVALGLNLERIGYSPLIELPRAGEKVARDAAAIAVATV
jgi:class 3 adenylate cyclase